MPGDRTLKTRSLPHLLFALLIGTLFLLPHLIRMEALHSISSYSPFSARSSSPTTIDETYLYAAEVNFTYRHHRLAYDTDAFEHRGQPMPYSVLPIEVEVAFANTFRSVAATQIFCCFLFPAITAWLLIVLFLRFDASIPLAALLALVTLIASFSLRTLQIGISDLLLHGLHSGFIETLQASRNPNPNMTFPLFLGALIVLVAAVQHRSTSYAVIAGILGGLLFYSYIYYAIAWAAACALLTLLVFVRQQDYWKPPLIALVTTIFLALPFLLWVRAAKRGGGYVYRSKRLGLVNSHLPYAHDLKLSAVFAGCLVLLWLAWRYFAARSANAEVPFGFSASAMVFGCAAAGGILGMNMEILTGYDLQFGHHFPHMVIQPTLILFLVLLLLVATSKMRRGGSTFWPGALFVLIFAACAANQSEAAINSAPLHRVIPSERTLFQWLNHNTRPDDVVATTSLELAEYMPVYSQNYTLMVEGSRTLASDSEILDRYLLAEALTGASATTVANDLGRSGEPAPSGESRFTYPSFFFEHSPDLKGPRELNPSIIETALARYRSLNLSDELKRFRVNYLYIENGQRPADIAGVEWKRVLVTSDGTLWQLDSYTNQ